MSNESQRISATGAVTNRPAATQTNQTSQTDPAATGQRPWIDGLVNQLTDGARRAAAEPAPSKRRAPATAHADADNPLRTREVLERLVALSAEDVEALTETLTRGADNLDSPRERSALLEMVRSTPLKTWVALNVSREDRALRGAWKRFFAATDGLAEGLTDDAARSSSDGMDAGRLRKSVPIDPNGTATPAPALPPPATAKAKAADRIAVSLSNSEHQGAWTQRMAAHLGLEPFIADGVITQAEAQAIGTTFVELSRIAAREGDPASIDTYAELASITSRVHALSQTEIRTQAVQGDYVVFAPQRLHASLTPLLNHRELVGHGVVLVDPEDAAAAFGTTRQQAMEMFLRTANEARDGQRPKLVFFVGDRTTEVPSFSEKTSQLGHAWMWENEFPSDNRFGQPDRDGVPQIVPGRLPTGAVRDVDAYVSKVLRYEVGPTPAAARALLVDGDPMWGKFTGRVVDWVTRKESGRLDPVYDGRRVSFNEFGKSGAGSRADVRAQLDDDPIALVYFGHGSEHWTDAMTTSDQASLARSDARPFALIYACQTGAPDGLAERSVTRGPFIGAFAASEISMPHNNLALGAISAEELLDPDHATIGDVLRATKQRMATNDVDGVAGFVQGVGDFGLTVGELLDLATKTRLSHQYMYNYIGDPGVRPRRPQALESLEAPRWLRRGRTLTVEAALPAGVNAETAVVVLERPFGKTVERLENPLKKKLDAEERTARQQRNAERINERAILRAVVPVQNGRVSATLTLPKGTRDGRYNLRVYAVGSADAAAGSRRLNIYTPRHDGPHRPHHRR